MKSIDALKIEKEQQQKCYYKYNCDFCHRDIIFNLKDEFVEHILFEPKEKIQQVLEYYPEEEHKFKEIKCKQTVSSNPDEDIIKFSCPACGHYHTIKWKDIKNNFCNYWGNNNIIFELSETETNNARLFMDEHLNCNQEKLGKMFFSSTGGQFTYTIQPTGLGNIITITCNACGETKTISDDF